MEGAKEGVNMPPSGHAHPSSDHAYYTSDASNERRSSVFFMDVEIDQSCNSQLLCNMAPEHSGKFRLLSYQEAPTFLKHNPFVQRGYRAYLPFSGCVKSLLTWSNETVNIWSHLLGFFLFLALLIYDNAITLPAMRGSISDHLVISAGLVCYMFCMVCSTGYHVFHCHSEVASRRWLMADIAGICVGLIGCYIPAVHFAFYCSSIWRDLYLFIVSILCLAVLYIQLNSRFLSRNPSRHWYSRIILLFGLVCYGIIPVCHWVYLNGGWTADLVQIYVPNVLVMYCMGALAFLIYLTRMPERCLPGRVDYVGSSHQWWHVLVVISFVYWHNAGQRFLLYRLDSQCNGTGT